MYRVIAAVWFVAILLVLETWEARGQSPEVPGLVKMLKDPMEVKKGANGLGKLGFEARTAVGDLAETLRKVKLTTEKVAVADAMEKILGACHTRHADLRAKLKKPKDDKERSTLSMTLDEIDTAIDAGVPALSEVLSESRYKEERIALSRALGACGPSARPAVSVLTTSLKIGPAESQVAAAEALGQIGAEAREAVPTLMQIASAKTGSAAVRKAATAALLKIQGKKK